MKGRKSMQSARGSRPGGTKPKRARPAAGARQASPRRRRPTSRLRKRLNRLKRAIVRHPILIGAVRYTLFASLCLAIVGGTALALFIARLPDPMLDTRPPNVIVRAADGTILAERGFRRGHVSLDALSPHLINAVLATEDRRFYWHLGIDPLGLIRAGIRNTREGAVVEGGSTITQQLAKNLFLKPERTIARKLEELIYAVWLERRFTKDEILELYLNRVYFGGGAYGVEAAARHYFGKPALDLTLPQAALLAGLLKAPSRYTPRRSVKLANGRITEVLDRMVDAGFIEEAQARVAVTQPLGLAAKGDDTGYPYAVDWVAELLPEFVGENHGDLIVDTTIDAGLQRNAQKALRQLLDREGQKSVAEEGAVVVLDPSGGVKAVVGGRSYQASPFDRAIKALRQPGSAFKPFVYLAALEAGYSPNSRAIDGPTTIEGWSPRNYTGTYRGEVSLREGLTHSLNTVAAKVAAAVGASRVAHTAHRLGIQTELHHNPSLALGTAEVTLLELTGAYVPFANGGQKAMAHIITRIRTSDGKVVYARKPPASGQAVASRHVGAMNDMLNSALVRGTGKRAAIPLHVAAGKTGTTQASRDAWFVGYTAHYIAGVWIGNDDNTPMRKVTGGSLPAQLWHDIMISAHADKTPLALPGTRGSYDAIARLPWNDAPAQRTAQRPLIRRIFSFFGG
jgi:penicillin-binding protein 1A